MRIKKAIAYIKNKVAKINEDKIQLAVDAWVIKVKATSKKVTKKVKWFYSK